MSALYRQYRPRRFSDVVGQDHVTQTLANAITQGKISHAYLFQGPRGTGKTTTARLLAKRLNCSSPEKHEPCTTCDSCVSAQEGRNIDVIEIDAASNRGIDDVRSLRENVRLSPSIGTYKVYIIDEVHMLSGPAFAALLKTLEEPVKHAVFILATTELHKVPPTILSRCQVYRFRRASQEKMKQRIGFLLEQEKREASTEVIDFIISRSDGCYRDAESLLGQMLSMEGDISLDHISTLLGMPSPDVIESWLASLIAGNTSEAVSIADKAYADGFDPEQFIQESIRMARDAAVLLAKNSGDIPSFATAPGASTRLPVIIRSLLQASQDLSYVPEPMIAVHLAILTVCAKSTPASQPRQPAQQASSIPQRPAIVHPKPAPNPVIQPAQQQVPKTQPAMQTSSPPKNQSPSGSVSLDNVVNVWSTVISNIKKENPVSSTFLRAIEPIGVEGSVVTLRAQFPLHQKFFEKQEHKSMVEKTLSDAVGSSVTVRCVLEEGRSLADQREEKRQKEQELVNTVKEVFGS